jgi:hypothetical protein
MSTSTDRPVDQPASSPAELEHHPAAALFPLLPVDSPEFGELVADIGEHGLLQPIVLHEGRILDGRNRYRACQHAGVTPRFDEWSGESPTAYVLSLNLHRRHLTEDQRAAIAVEAKERFEEEAREVQRRAGAQGHEGGRGKHKTLRVDSHEGFPARDHAAEWARRPLARAAAETGVASNRIRVAEGVKKADPKLFEQVHAGAVPLRGAVKEIEHREAEEVRATLDRIDPEGAVRQQQAKLIADWSTQAAKVGHLVTDLMGFDLDEIVPQLDELNRYAAGSASASCATTATAWSGSWSRPASSR